jgi:hypothetical protein
MLLPVPLPCRTCVSARRSTPCRISLSISVCRNAASASVLRVAGIQWAIVLTASTTSSNVRSDSGFWPPCAAVTVDAVDVGGGRGLADLGRADRAGEQPHVLDRVRVGRADRHQVEHAERELRQVDDAGEPLRHVEHAAGGSPAGEQRRERVAVHRVAELGVEAGRWNAPLAASCLVVLALDDLAAERLARLERVRSCSFSALRLTVCGRRRRPASSRCARTGPRARAARRRPWSTASSPRRRP